MGKSGKTLTIWMNGIKVGEWRFIREHEFQYDRSWLENRLSRPLSLSLPLSSALYKGDKVEAFFSNLLPDTEEIRDRIRSRYSLTSKSAFDLLYQIGRDCVGAIQLLSPDTDGKAQNTIRGKEVSADRMAELLRQGIVGLVRELGEDFRISLAGAQEKSAFLYYRGHWMIPLGSTPTTNILKLPLGRIGDGSIDLNSSVENEWLCCRIIQLFGVKTASSDIQSFHGQRVLNVKRFDRRFSEDKSRIIRLPQEDFCQATGIPSALKYESDGGPGIVEIMDLLRGSSNSDDDRRTFFKTQILFFILGAIDGHAKNFSIFILPGGRYHLTPLYDVLSIYPHMGNRSDKIHPRRVKMAMAFSSGKGKIYHWDKIHRRHIFYTAKAAGLPEAACEKILNDILLKLPGVIAEMRQVIPSHIPDELSDSIFAGMERAARRLS